MAPAKPSSGWMSHWLRAGFVEHAKGWAEAVGVAVSAFLELEVPDEALREAGSTCRSVPGAGGGAGPQAMPGRGSGPRRCP